MGQSGLPLPTTASRVPCSPGDLATARLSSPRGARSEAQGTSGHTAFTGDARLEREQGRSDFHSLTRNRFWPAVPAWRDSPLSGPRSLDLAPSGHCPAPAWLTVQRESGPLWSFLIARKADAQTWRSSWLSARAGHPTVQDGGGKEGRLGLPVLKQGTRPSRTPSPTPAGPASSHHHF